ncbi:heat-inducible transcriptional repressor HrcA [Microbacterium karelineae]|uniref:heat-inducible transcriptional repressor HrcA n=1 Tax=Microbacterium karelineae TaxID=2654283 RepID=UPI0012EAFD96|nr:heat-inducible transcriptional repressor HrcA [Microbacterium karelineae]
MVTDRGLQVLRAIVRDFVDTHEPVGSRAIVERHAFGVSAATIRNDMALLEEENLIAQPHTSSGRVPTDKGYRAFVDHLSDVRPLSRAQRTAIEAFLADPADLDDLLARTVRLLTQLTGQVALVQYPSFARATLTHAQLVALDARRLLVIMVTDTGRVSQRIAILPAELADADAEAVSSRLAPLIVGHPVGDAAERVEVAASGLADPQTPRDRALLAVFAAVSEELDEFRQNRLVMAGAATLARREDDFRGSIHPLLEAIEEQVTLLRLMSEMAADDNGLATSIGRENAAFGLGEASIVASEYDATVGRARVGLMGPTRMDYPRNLAAARAVARYLTRVLEEDEAR